MSCPDWRRLAAAGEDFLRPGDERRQAALRHAAGCEECRREALRLDPSLAAAALPPLAVSRSEVDAIKTGVLALRRARRAERESRRRPAAGRLAAVACLTLAILLFTDDAGDRSPGETEVAGAVGARAADVAASPLLTESYRLYGSLPLVESLEPAEARVYQLGREDFSLVWIVDESITLGTRP